MATDQSIELQVRDMDKYVEAAKRTEPDYGPVVQRLADPRIARLLHVALGLVTEAAEFADQLKKHLFYGKPLDTVNLSEELGDITWYQRLGVDELETTLLAVLDQNVAKLRARFPQKFEEAQAITRDLDAERAVLERGECSGPLPGHNVTVVQTGKKTLFIRRNASGPLDAQGIEPGLGKGKVSL